MAILERSTLLLKGSSERFPTCLSKCVKPYWGAVFLCARQALLLWSWARKIGSLSKSTSNTSHGC